MEEKSCYHCGDVADQDIVVFDEKTFCCHGCKTVYQIFKDNDLTAYYDFEKNPGLTPDGVKGKYGFLNNTTVVSKLLDFQEDGIEVVTLYIPKIHCSSCVWVLEHLQKLNDGIVNSRVHFSKKTVQVTYNNKITLQQLVELLAMIGYDPYISLEDGEKAKNKSKSSIYKLAIAGFAFGNSMFLSFPDYFGKPDIWLAHYQPLFVLLMFLFSLPVVFYAANDYFISAYKGLRKRILNIDVPISIGVLVLFLRSSYEFFSGTGQGYFDSLTGLIFFLLLGKLFQQKTYDFLSFERDFKSYFPIAISTWVDEKEVIVPVNEIQINDIIIIRNEEVIPTDGIVVDGNPKLDYSFVTGEANLIEKQIGDKVFAGGKQQGKSITLKVTKTVDQSYLTKLWSQNSYEKTSKLTNLTDAISQYFTWGLLFITLASAIYWFLVDKSQIINVVTSILIVACPCALALSAPFAFGNVLRILGKQGFYLKDSTVIEKIANIQTIFFDKTGTLTTRNKQEFTYEGAILSNDELSMVKSLVRNSNHPLSRTLFKKIKADLLEIVDFDELEGNGIQGVFNQKSVKVGSANFVGISKKEIETESRVYVSIDGVLKGFFKFGNQYRNDIFKTLKRLSKKYQINILSGDNDASKVFLENKLTNKAHFYFNQSPQDKLEQVKACQQKNQSVMMVGDGLNDAGALLQSEVGIAVAEDVNVFSPASDAIIDASKINKMPIYFKFCKVSLVVVKISFLLSILYNIVGLYFAISGMLTPLIAAILMPLSSITIVVFVTVATNVLGRGIRRKI
ncbi:heavy metal translocating P-type ATPase metal-binding domain-containing protein [Wenyingzhuangia sp. chi5]|uniref:Heavy metal translocating P-type ATPase metal-binding domain-containing protein n=1 Tax=Wenyingzhuangia gilva TaxID=3057677 RepID=A0ABT8VS49_9FLAO|nr:heavy metal translocating P-type ATPase metal-binding domain-containing protein [Wenyingzhuangia sp. chi5]MDO3694793.1 heavy metal translocating P-type ATPase metal-binding domain-containing protein [Wenyingzhuangia sp. chi5]